MSSVWCGADYGVGVIVESLVWQVRRGGVGAAGVSGARWWFFSCGWDDVSLRFDPSLYLSIYSSGFWRVGSTRELTGLRDLWSWRQRRAANEKETWARRTCSCLWLDLLGYLVVALSREIVWVGRVGCGCDGG